MSLQKLLNEIALISSFLNSMKLINVLSRHQLKIDKSLRNWNPIVLILDVALKSVDLENLL